MELFIFKFIKFSIVGFSGLLIDFSLTWLLKEKAKINKYLANATGFITAATSNYILNRLWTFRSENPEIFIEYISFVSIAIIGLVINSLILRFLVEKKQIRFYLSKIFAIGVIAGWNFLANYFITFGTPLTMQGLK